MRDSAGQTASDYQPVEATDTLLVTVECPQSATMGDVVPLSATVTAHGGGAPSVKYYWSASTGSGGASSSGNGAFDDLHSAAPKWTAPVVNAQTTYTISVDVSAPNYAPGGARCEISVSPPPDYGPIIEIGIAISIAVGGGWYIYNKKKNPPIKEDKPPAKEDKCDSCEGFAVTAPPSITFNPTWSDSGGDIMEWKPSFRIPIHVHWPGSMGQAVTLTSRMLDGSGEFKPGSDRIVVTEQADSSLTVNVTRTAPDTPPEGDYRIEVTATGYTRSGKRCTDTATVTVHVCSGDPCSIRDTCGSGDCGITDSSGIIQLIQEPLSDGDKIRTGDDGELKINLNQTLEQNARNQGVISPTEGGGGEPTGMVVERNTDIVWNPDPVSWLRPPDAEQWAKIMEGMTDAGLREIIGHEAGKMFLDWRQAGKAMKATVLLWRSPAVDKAIWAADVTGTKLLVEATRDGSAAAITVIEDYRKPSAVAVWRLSEPREKILVHGGEQLVIRGGKAASPVKFNIDPNFKADPFGVLRRWGQSYPASAESLAALTAPPPVGINCPRCGRTMRPGEAFCSNCCTKTPPPEQPIEKLSVDVFEKCSKCSEPIRPGKKFCMKCGAECSPAGVEKPIVSTGQLKCVKCGEPIRAGKKFCLKCGTRQGNASGEKQKDTVVASRCSKCGEPVRPGKKFCLHCGTPQVRDN